MKNIGKVVLWILFWYFLLPYVLLKKYVFKNAKRKKLWSSLVAGVLVLFLFSKISDDEDTQSEQANSIKIHYVTKRLGTKELAKEKTRAKSLEEEKNRKEKEYNELKSELEDQEDKEKDTTTESQTHEKQASNEKSSSMSTSKEVSKNEKKTKDTISNDTSSTVKGDLDTRETGQIIGNSKSKIYHVPGQAGYHMNSANAVYFNSEQEAIDAVTERQ